MVLLYRNADFKLPQQIFIMNLSAVECLRNILYTQANPRICTLGRRGERKVFNVEFVINVVYYTCMLFITIDRMLAALLNLTYRVHCTIERARKVLLVQWFGALALLIVLWVSNPFYHNRKVIPRIYVGFAILYLIAASSMYVIIFVTLIRSRSRTQQNHVQNQGIFRRFCESKFYIAVLIISSFTVFVVASDLCYILMGSSMGYHTSTLIGTRFLCLAISDLFDGFIYIFLNQKVRALVRMTWKRLKRYCLHNVYPSVMDVLRIIFIRKNSNRSDKKRIRNNRVYPNDENNRNMTCSQIMKGKTVTIEMFTPDKVGQSLDENNEQDGWSITNNAEKNVVNLKGRHSI